MTLWFWLEEYTDVGIPLWWEWAVPSVESKTIWWDWGTE
jgi:hypothetical protein